MKAHRQEIVVLTILTLIIEGMLFYGIFTAETPIGGIIISLTAIIAGVAYITSVSAIVELNHEIEIRKQVNKALAEKEKWKL